MIKNKIAQIIPSIILLSLIMGFSYSTNNEIKGADHGVYGTVNIGGQEWMVKNLDVSYFRNGDEILEAKTAEEWLKAGDNNEPAWCYYNNDEKGWGKLYNWYAVNFTTGNTSPYPSGYAVRCIKD